MIADTNMAHGPERMDTKPKLLLVDDETDFLAVYREILDQLPSRPEVHTAPSGRRAMAMIESDNYRLLICDLKMPHMDGFQILSAVRRRYPHLRTVALTGEPDEQMRSRAYALGVDLFWHKPTNQQEVGMFLECIESLLGKESESGFRGVQNKSLMDIIQLECISQSSSLLRINNGPLLGRIWIQDGELIDAETGELRGEPAFVKILSWKNGAFEILGPEAGHARTIEKSYNALLLESAQAMDESLEIAASGAPEPAQAALKQLSQVEGVEFVLTMKAGQNAKSNSRGLENPERMSAWAKQTVASFQSLGERLHAGVLGQVEGFGPQRHVVLAHQSETDFCVGWTHTLRSDQVREQMKKVLSLWAS